MKIKEEPRRRKYKRDMIECGKKKTKQNKKRLNTPLPKTSFIMFKPCADI